jgi:hypothetical protein
VQQVYKEHRVLLELQVLLDLRVLLVLVFKDYKDLLE